MIESRKPSSTTHVFVGIRAFQASEPADRASRFRKPLRRQISNSLELSRVGAAVSGTTTDSVQSEKAGGA
jgi:hypothetical protein